MSQFDHESEDQSELANRLFRDLKAAKLKEPKPDLIIQRVELHLPAEFREVARLANQAGLDGHELVDAEYGVDMDKWRRRQAELCLLPVEEFINVMESGRDVPRTRVLLTYRKRTQAELREYLLACGWAPEDFEGGIVPQGVKFIDFLPLTKADKARVKQLIAEHPEWSPRQDRAGTPDCPKQEKAED